MWAPQPSSPESWPTACVSVCNEKPLLGSAQGSAVFSRQGRHRLFSACDPPWAERVTPETAGRSKQRCLLLNATWCSALKCSRADLRKHSVTPFPPTRLRPVSVLKLFRAFPLKKRGFWAGKIDSTPALKTCWFRMEPETQCARERVSQRFQFQFIYFQRGQMRVLGVYASCRYIRITPGTVNNKTEVLHYLQKHQDM